MTLRRDSTRGDGAVHRRVFRSGAGRIGGMVRSATLFDLPLVAFATCVVLAGAAAHEPASAQAATRWILLWSGLALAIGWGARSRGVWLACTTIAVASGAIAAVMFVTQYSSLSVESKVGLIDDLGRFLSRPFPPLLIWQPFSNSAATWFEGFLLLAVGAVCDDRFRRLRVPLAAMTALLALALILTMSRGAWLGVLVGGLLAGAVRWTPRPWRGELAGGTVLGTLGLGLAMTFVAGLAVVGWLTTWAGGLIVRPDRMDIYRHSATLVDAVGLTGLGPGGQFAQAFSRFALAIQVPFVTYPHQLPLHVWLAFGALGVIAWTWWVATAATAISTAERYQSSPSFRGAWAGLLAVLVHGLSDARQAVDPWTWGPLFVLTGLIVARCRRLEARPPAIRFAWSWASLVVVGGVVLARHTPLTAAWHSSVGHQLEARCLVAGTDVADRPAVCRAAIESYRRAIASDPNQAAARRRLALDAADRVVFSEALSHMTVALESDPQSLASRKIGGLVAAWAGEERLAAHLLGPVPGAADELLVWSTAWKDRGVGSASESSRHVALLLGKRSKESVAATRP